MALISSGAYGFGDIPGLKGSYAGNNVETITANLISQGGQVVHLGRWAHICYFLSNHSLVSC